MEADMSSFLYFDTNATAPLRAPVKEAMITAMEWVGNPSSVHECGREIRKHIEATRAKVADYFQSTPAQVVFTSGATEANNTLIQGFKGRVIISAIEHDSVTQANDRAMVCPVDENGIISLKTLETLLSFSEGPTLVSVMAANNETGVIQPLREIVDLARHYKAYIHTDAVQAVGRLNMEWAALDIDAVTFSTHKVGGPPGVGGYVAKQNLPFVVPFRGGGQERSYRPGTENSIGIMGMGALFDGLNASEWRAITGFRDEIESTIQEMAPTAHIFGQAVERLPNTSNLTMPHVKSATQVMAFDLRGIAVSAGSACSSGKVKKSHVLQAMGIPSDVAETALRVSLGWETTARDVQRFIQAWKEIYTIQANTSPER